MTANARRLRLSTVYRDGLIEPQDAASQAVADMVPVGIGAPVLDYCAGGGGKALALAARGAAVFAHDASPARMADLPARAARAGADIPVLNRAEARARAPWRTVLVDAPCSGSGAWRRDPEGKWRLTPARLADLTALQDRILDEAAALIAPGGALVYATCSLLAEENDERIAAFISTQPRMVHTRHASPHAVGRRGWIRRGALATPGSRVLAGAARGGPAQSHA